MTKVNVNDVPKTPSEEVLKKASQEFVVTDEIGRKILLKKPNILAQYRLIEVLGESSKNQVYLNMIQPVIYVSSIDGIPVMFPTKKSEIEAIIQRLDEHGIAAVFEGIQEHFGTQVSVEEVKESLKK